MSDSNNLSYAEIAAQPVADKQRLKLLIRAFPGFFIQVESAVCDGMRRRSVDYKGGSWNFVRPSNGGAFMWPQMQGPVAISVGAYSPIFGCMKP